jgi:multiple sugar transport system permease protein
MKNLYKSKQTLINISLHAVVYLIFLAIIFPYVYMILSSFKNPLDLVKYPPSWIFTPTLENYRKVIFDKDFFFYAKNSAIVAVVNTFMAFMLAIPAAFALAKSKQKRKGLWVYLILLLQMVPPIGVVITFFIIAQTLRMIDTLYSLILFELLWTTPLAIWLLRGYFINFPNELIESARIDGYSLYGILFKIIVPLTAPGILATSIFVFIRVWNDFVLAFFITIMRARTLPTTIDFYLVYTQIEWGLMFAAATLTTLPIVIFAVLNRKYFSRGGTMGAIKE